MSIVCRKQAKVQTKQNKIKTKKFVKTEKNVILLILNDDFLNKMKNVGNKCREFLVTNKD
ncbi:hypothetical protein PGB90_005265 [Kerria lacca]